MKTAKDSTRTSTMPGVPQRFECENDVAEFRHPAHHTGLELYRAHITRYAFEPHTHDGFGLGAIEAGVERFRYRGADHLAPPDSIVLMNPDELHTGRAETEDGWRYRMIYIDPQRIVELTGESGWWFAEAVHADKTCARRVTSLLDELWHTQEPLAFDGLLLKLLDECRKYAKISRPASPEGSPRFTAALDYMRANLANRITLDNLAATVQLSPFHFLRSFRKQHHVTPQQMLMALRLSEAKRLLTSGVSPAQVAFAVGLTDQAHLTRAFTQRYGVTPARYQRQVNR